MNRKNLIFGIGCVLIAATVLIFSCSKDNTNNNTSSFTSSQVSQAQDVETQDAVVQTIDNDVDQNISTLQENNFSGSLKESTGCIIVNIDHPDTTFWPKVITLIYNCSDTINNEIFSRTGTVTVTMDTLPGANTKFWRTHFKRTIQFTDLKFATDSSSLTINGTRYNFRKSATIDFMNDERIIHAHDSIVSAVTLTIDYDGMNKNVTRNINRIHETTLYALGIPLVHRIKYVPEFEKDTVVITGDVTGVDASGSDYTRSITTPLVVTFCPYWPHNIILFSGSITQTIDTSNIVFTYKGDGCRTIVTIDKNGVTRVIDRKFRRRFHRWW
jgi:hypothetical protein